MAAMQHKGKILDRTLPAMDEFEANAFLDDLAISEDADKAITAGLFRLETGEPMTYTYTYHEMKLILDGEVTISDDTGQSVDASRGDLFYFPADSTITFTTADFVLAYFVGQRGEGEA